MVAGKLRLALGRGKLTDAPGEPNSHSHAVLT
jgi:hypothetical protein